MRSREFAREFAVTRFLGDSLGRSFWEAVVCLGFT